MASAYACARTAVVLLIGLGVTRVAVAEEKPEQAKFPEVPAFVRETEARLREELDRPTILEFIDTELSTVLRYLEDAHKTQIVLDNDRLESIGFLHDTLITHDLRDVPFYLALDMILEPHDATWVVRDGLLLITTEEATYSTKVYPLGELLKKQASGEPDFKSIIDVLTTTIAPNSWDEAGSSGCIQPYAGTLVIYQSAPVHRKIDRLLAELQEATSGDSPARESQADAREVSADPFE